MNLIDEMEIEARGIYGGAVGEFCFNGNCNFAIPIRSIFINKNEAYIQTCGGIVYDSEASKEYNEIQSINIRIIVFKSLYLIVTNSIL